MINADRIIAEAQKDCEGIFASFEKTEEFNTAKVLAAFKRHRVSERHFAPTTGYGYDDIGRDTLGKIYADVFGCESALVRPQIASGTHALALCLYGLLRPGDTLLSAAGKPYDTLEEIIGLTGKRGSGSLTDFGIKYKEVALRDGKPDMDEILKNLTPDVKLVLIQRSRGYDLRPSLGVAEINSVIEAVHRARNDVYVMTDNCYGEFTDTAEPKADIMAGSLIKNPGGGLAPTGAYIAGKAECVDKVAYRLTSPGIGAEVGSYAASYRAFYQGFFMAPHTVCQALKIACLFARVLGNRGCKVYPAYNEKRNDIIQAVCFEDEQKLIHFIQTIQEFSPVDSEAVPEPWDMPGYTNRVIMAAGTFVAGASIELSADAPIKPPYAAYMQGGLVYSHGKIVLGEMLRRGII